MCSMFVCLHVNHGGNLLLTGGNQHRECLVSTKSAGFSLYSNATAAHSTDEEFAENCRRAVGGQNRTETEACRPRHGTMPSIPLMDPGFACQIHSDIHSLSRREWFISYPDSDLPQRGEARSAASHLPSHPRRHLSTRLAEALLLSLGEERQPWLQANGSASFWVFLFFLLRSFS